MGTQEEAVNDFENDFVNSGLNKLVDDETIKKVAQGIDVEVIENEEITEKTKIFFRILKPIGFLVTAFIVSCALIKNVIGVEKFVGFAENFIKLMLL